MSMSSNQPSDLNIRIFRLSFNHLNILKTDKHPGWAVGKISSAVAKLIKATTSFVVSVCLSVSLPLLPHRTRLRIFMKFDVWEFLKNLLKYKFN